MIKESIHWVETKTILIDVSSKSEEGYQVNLEASKKENEDVEVGGELPKGVVTGKQTKGRCKRQLLKDDTEVLKEVQNISSSVENLRLHICVCHVLGSFVALCGYVYVCEIGYIHMLCYGIM